MTDAELIQAAKDDAAKAAKRLRHLEAYDVFPVLDVHVQRLLREQNKANVNAQHH